MCDRPHARRDVAPEWPLARLDPVLRALLRAGAAELADARTARPRASSSTNTSTWRTASSIGDEPRMANGVLDRLARRLRADEFNAAS